LCRDVRGGVEAPEAFVTFLKVLAENHRLHLLPSIAVLFERLRAEAESVVRAELISAPSP
jgi:F-type H+-transporting ATPase subunit delta